MHKKIIFTYTTGRSGTGYLCHCLSGLPGIVSTHEPSPKFSDVTRFIARNSSVPVQFLRDFKIPEIENSPGSLYIETSHLTCKGFLFPLLDLGINFDLIYLSRNCRDVAKSLYTLNTIPIRTDLGQKFLLSPTDDSILLQVDHRYMTDYQLCYWYTKEIELRKIMHFNTFMRRGVSIFKTTIDLMSDKRHLEDLLTWIYSKTEITPSIPELVDSVFSKTRIRINSKAANKDASKISALEQIDFDQSEYPIDNAFLARLSIFRSLYKMGQTCSENVTPSDTQDMARHDTARNTYCKDDHAQTTTTHILKQEFCSILQYCKQHSITFHPSFFNEHAYLEQNPDVQIAVKSNRFPSGFWHWIMHGIDEGRALK